MKDKLIRLSDVLQAVRESYIWDSEISQRTLEKKLAALPEAEARAEWIPVSEELPKEDGIYLVCFPDGIVLSSSWHKDTNYNNGFDRYLTAIHEDSRRKSYNVGVRAWMPLPEPCKEAD